MSTSFTQTTVYFPSNESPFASTSSFIGNVSNLGVSQCISITAEKIIAVNEVVSLPFQVAVPPPLLYLSTSTANDTLTIQSPDGLIISTDANATGAGFNGQHYQPSAGGRYIMYYKSGTAKAIGDPMINIQAVLENTIGQFISMGSISYPTEQENGKQPEVSQTIALNTTSAVPNTLNIDFERVRVKKGINVLATFRIMVNSSGVETWGKSYLSTVGASTRTVQLIAGQNYPAIWYSPEDGYFSGRYSVTISQSGNLTLPATCTAFSAPDMFPTLVSNTPEMYTSAQLEQSTTIDVDKPRGVPSIQSAISSYQMDEIVGTLAALVNKLNDLDRQVSDKICKFSEENRQAHSYQNTKIAEIIHSIGGKSAGSYGEPLANME